MAVFIHGAWVTPASFDSFRSRFEAAGWQTLAPAWPHMDRPVETLRRKPDEGFAALTVRKLADHYEAVVRALPKPPLLVGHSFGGLIAQLLLGRGVGAAGIAIDPAPIAGVIPGPVTLRAGWPILSSWNGWSKVFTMPEREFARSFANYGTPEIQHENYERYAVPAPGRLFWTAALGLGSAAHPKRRAAPLLLISGDDDLTVSPYIIHATMEKQRKSKAPTEFRRFAGRTHFLIVQPGWEEVADSCIDWAAATKARDLRS